MNRNYATPISGVYAITHLATGNQYIGSSRNIARRWYVHRSTLRTNTHHTSRLQRTWNKYGEDAFSFTIIEYVEPTRAALQAREQHYLDTLQPAFNTLKVAYNSVGHVVSEATREKLRGIMRARSMRFSDEAIRKSADARRGRPLSEATRRKVSASNRGKHDHSPEIRERLAAAQRGRTHSPVAREKMRQAKVGRRIPHSTRQVMSWSQTKRRQQERAARPPVFKQMEMFPETPAQRGGRKQRGVPRPYVKAHAQERARKRRVALANITEKVCLRCGVLLPVSQYIQHSRNPDGYDTHCKACISVYNKRKRQEKSERIMVETGLSARERQMAGFQRFSAAQRHETFEQTLMALHIFWHDRQTPVTSLWNLADLLAQQMQIPQRAVYQRLRSMARTHLISADGHIL